MLGRIGTAMITSDKKQNMPLYITEKEKIYYNDILHSLQKVGVERGHIIFVHSDVSVFGKIGDIKNRDEFLGLILQSFKEAIGTDGTIIIPTFSYSFCRNEIYNPNSSPSKVGALTTYFRKQPGVVRTIHPIFSVGIWGKEKGYFNLNLSKDCFDKDSIFGKLHKHNGKIIAFGSPFATSATFLHYIEQSHGIPYRYMKTFHGKIRIGDIEYKDQYTYFVRYLDRNVILDTTRLEQYLLEKGLMREVRLGDGRILMIESGVLFKEGRKLLDRDVYFFLKEKPKPSNQRGAVQNICELHFDKLPFYFGIFGSPKILDFPHSLPFSLVFNDDLGLIVKKSSSEVDLWIKKAYEFGSSLSTPLDEGSFGKERCEDIIHALQCSTNSIEGKSFLEIGCNKGYLLYLLKRKGAARCLGIEPNPISRIGIEKYGIEIIQDFFNPQNIKEKFYVVFTHGVLEHVKNPLEFLKDLKDCTKYGGIIFTAVPNCELELSIGDLSLVGHEHYNYFTTRSLYNLYQKLGLGSVRYRSANYGWMLYMWGKVKSKGSMRRKSFEENVFQQEEKLFNNYVRLCQNMVNRIQGMINLFESNGKSIGIYGAYSFFLMFKWKKIPRFFDGDVAKHGKFLPGCTNPIENPNLLVTKPVDSIWIAPINHNSAIKNFLEHKLKVPKDRIVSMKEIYESEKKRMKEL